MSRGARIIIRVREMQGGRVNDSRFGRRMRGQGVWAELLRQRFDKACARLGLNRLKNELDLTRFRRPAVMAAQGQLFRALRWRCSLLRRGTPVAGC